MRLTGRDKLPKAILFDLDDTILWFGDRQTVLTQVAEEFADTVLPHSPPEIGTLLEAGFVRFWSDPDRYQRWRFDLPEARFLIIDRVFESIRDTSPALTTEFARQFARRFHFRREEEARFFPGALEALDELNFRGVMLALLTNGSAIAQRSKIDKFDLASRFKHIQIEGEVGYGKPDPRAYQRALEALNVSPGDAWMVGDNLEWEVEAPQRLGIYAVWNDFRGKGLPANSTVKPDRIIHLISELL